MQVCVTEDIWPRLYLEHPCQLFQRFYRHVNRVLMRQPVGAKCALRGTFTMSRMQLLCLKGLYPSYMLCRIKGFFVQRLEDFSGYNDLVNLFEDAPQLPPVLIRHSRKTGIPVDKGVDDHYPIHELHP